MKIKVCLWIVVIGLVASGATAIPLREEMAALCRIVPASSSIGFWVFKIRDALVEVDAKYPFLNYGTDWLAFGHFVIAIAFIGPLRDPIRNRWVVQFGMIACALILPYAFLMGAARGIPLGWRLADCAFGILGVLPLWCAHRLIRRLEKTR